MMLIVLNGPAGVGKDTLGLRIQEDVTPAKLMSFKTPLWDVAEAMLGKDKFELFCDMYHDRKTKELPLEALGGWSPRQFFIHISEKVLKPIFGEEYMGDRMLELYQEHQLELAGQLCLVTDGGFPLELFPFLRAGTPVLVVRLHRSGYTFEGDSRNYLQPEHFESLPQHMRPVIRDLWLEDGEIESAVSTIHDMWEKV